jgi:hypothetical protein
MALQFAEKLPIIRITSHKTTESDRLHEQKLSILREGIEEAKQKLRSAQRNFDFVTEPKLIDFYIYKIQAEQSRYEQLLLEYRTEEQNYIHTSAK